MKLDLSHATGRKGIDAAVARVWTSPLANSGILAELTTLISEDVEELPGVTNKPELLLIIMEIRHNNRLYRKQKRKGPSTTFDVIKERWHSKKRTACMHTRETHWCHINRKHLSWVLQSQHTKKRKTRRTAAELSQFKFSYQLKMGEFKIRFCKSCPGKCNETYSSQRETLCHCM